MSVAATFDGAPEHGTINFSVGQPSADLLPLELLRGACERFFAGAVPLELNYGERQGDPRFRAALAAFLRDSGGDSSASPKSLMLTAGISQALDFACSRFTRPGDTVFVEEPSYPYSFQIFRDHGLEGRRHTARRAGHGPRALRTRARAAPAKTPVHDSVLQQPDRADTQPGAPRAAGRAQPQARFHHRGRRGLPAVAPRHTAAAIARNAGRPRQRALVRVILEDPRARPAARLDPDQRGADAHPARQRRPRERRQLQSLHLACRSPAARRWPTGILCRAAALELRGAGGGDGRGLAHTPRRHRDLAETAGWLFLLARATGPHRCRENFRRRRARPAPASCPARPAPPPAA